MYGDFTYDYLKRFFGVLKNKFALRLLGDGLANHNGRPQLFLRHDIDVSVKRALTLAEIEADCGVRATYMFIPNSRLYNIRNDRDTLLRIDSLGHEVALHFDVDDQGREQGTDIRGVLAEIERDCRTISDITGSPVRSCRSQTRPRRPPSRTNPMMRRAVACPSSRSRPRPRSPPGAGRGTA